jgi:aspartyl-tRNA(Asn)/glutamyl-tRNA(Gln) amidotransferase subunit B
VLNEQNISIAEYPVAAEALAKLLARVRAGEFTTSRGREVLSAMVASRQSLDEAIAGLGIVAVDNSALESLCRDLIAANPKIVAEIKEGKLKGVGALIGQAKKKNANVDPNHVREMCLAMIEKAG